MSTPETGSDDLRGDGRSSRNLGLFLGFLAVFSFSLTLPLTRVAVRELGFDQITVWRGLLAALLALAILLVLRPARPVGREWRQLILCACGTVFGFPLFTSLAMESVSASQGAVVVGLLPLATAIFGVILGGERPSSAFWGTSIAGTILTLTFVLRQAGGSLSIGHLYLGLAVVTAGMGYAYGGRLAIRLKGWVVACWSLVVSLPILIIAAFFVPPVSPGSSPEVLGSLLYLALISQLGGFFAWYKGMALAGIARVSQIQLFQIFLTVGFSAVLLGEAWNADVLVFGGAVAVTVWISTRLRFGAVGRGRG